MAKTKAFEHYSNEYDEWFEKNSNLYDAELNVIKSMLKPFKFALEVGVGTGKFAKPFNIPIGIEPCPQMADKAQKLGINVFFSIAEKLPFKDKSFDFVLMVTTVCFVDDVLQSFKEVNRVLKNKGSFIVAYVDKDSELGKQYELKKNKSKFYSEATFYSSNEILNYLKQAGFNFFDIRQTIFKDDVNLIKEGFGEGSFVAISARK